MILKFNRVQWAVKVDVHAKFLKLSAAVHDLSAQFTSALDFGQL